MITARLAVASDGGGKLLQRIKGRQPAGNNDVALAGAEEAAAE